MAREDDDGGFHWQIIRDGWSSGRGAAIDWIDRYIPTAVFFLTALEGGGEEVVWGWRFLHMWVGH